MAVVMNNRWVLSATILLFLLSFVVIISWSSSTNQIFQFWSSSTNLVLQSSYSREQIQSILNNFNGSMTSICPNDTNQFQHFNYSPSSSPPSTCPENFKWIQEDLNPWKSEGITREMLDRGNILADFKLVIIKGKAYLEMYRKAFQTRDIFTLWGILQLLRLYPGKVPDLELLFNAGDQPKVDKPFFHWWWLKPPPPIFHYCGKNNASFDIIFPDWSFWGWGEIGIEPWESLLQKIEEDNKKNKWRKKIPYAFWKGAGTSGIRSKLQKCNASHHSNLHTYPLNWGEEIAQGFKNSKLEDQCTHRYKVYAEGVTWSVSDKYIMACNSMTLFIKPRYYDFFTRCMVPMKHYWPIKKRHLCSNIKHAVDWGNTHPSQAEEIAKSGSGFIAETLKMKFVYDYMFHVLNEYSKLLKFEPTIPEGAIEICVESVPLPVKDLWRQYMVETMVKSPSDTPPCTMSSPTND